MDDETCISKKTSLLYQISKIAFQLKVAHKRTQWSHERGILMDKVNPKSLKKGRHVACCVTGSLIGMKIEKDNKNFQVWLNTGLIGR